MPKISDEKKSARRIQILNAAWTCFQKQGLHATTMDNIIRTSGLSAGAVYSYFKNKDELIVSAVTTSMTGLAELLVPLLRAEPTPAPDALVRGITEKIATFTVREGFDLRRLAILGWGEAQRNPPVKAVLENSYRAFRDQLAAVANVWKQRDDIDKNADPEDVARTILAVALGFVAQSAILGDVEPAMLGRGLHALQIHTSAKK